MVARGGEDRRRSEVELEPVASMAAAALLRGGEAEADRQGASASMREDEDAIPSRCREGAAGRGGDRGAVPGVRTPAAAWRAPLGHGRARGSRGPLAVRRRGRKMEKRKNPL